MSSTLALLMKSAIALSFSSLFSTTFTNASRSGCRLSSPATKLTTASLAAATTPLNSFLAISSLSLSVNSGIKRSIAYDAKSHASLIDSASSVGCSASAFACSADADADIFVSGSLTISNSGFWIQSCGNPASLAHSS